MIYQRVDSVRTALHAKKRDMDTKYGHTNNHELVFFSTSSAHSLDGTERRAQ